MTPTTAVDLSPLIQTALAFLAVVLPALGAFLSYQLKRATDIKQNSAAAQVVDTATTDSAGLVYKLLAQLAPSVPHTVEIQNAMIAAGVQHALAAAGDSAKVREETGTSLGQTIAAKLGTLMAADPNVSIGPVSAGASAATTTTTAITKPDGTSGGSSTVTAGPAVPVVVQPSVPALVPPVPPIPATTAGTVP